MERKNIKYCTNCGTMLSGKEKFCPSCGQIIECSNENLEIVGQVKTKKKHNKLLIVVLGLVGMLLICVVAGSLGKSDNEEKIDEILEAFSKSYILPDELGMDKTVTETLDVLCGDEKIDFSERNDGMIDVIYQAKTKLYNETMEMELDLIYDPEKKSVNPVRMVMDQVEMDPRFMDAFLLKCAGYDTLSEEVLQQWKDGNSESYFEEIRKFDEEIKTEAQRLDEEFKNSLDEIESVDVNESLEEKEQLETSKMGMLQDAYDFAAWNSSEICSWYSQTTGYYLIPFVSEDGSASVAFSTENKLTYASIYYFVEGISADLNEQGGLIYQGNIYLVTREGLNLNGVVRITWDSEESIDFLTVDIIDGNQMTDVSMASDDYSYYGIVESVENGDGFSSEKELGGKYIIQFGTDGGAELEIMYLSGDDTYYAAFSGSYGTSAGETSGFLGANPDGVGYVWNYYDEYGTCGYQLEYDGLDSIIVTPVSPSAYGGNGFPGFDGEYIRVEEYQMP